MYSKFLTFFQPVITRKRHKWWTGNFAGSINFSSESFLLNLVSPTCPKVQTLDETQTGVFMISQCLVNPIKTKLVITPESVVTNFAKRNTTTSRKLMMTSYHQIMNSSLFFRVMADLEQSESRIPDALSNFYIFINNHL